MPYSTNTRERRIHNLSEDVLQRFISGELTLNQAYRECGLTQKNTNTEISRMRTAWVRASAHQRVEFLKWILHGETALSTATRDKNMSSISRRRNYGEEVYRHGKNLHIEAAWIEDATLEEIKERSKLQWAKLARLYHPDTGAYPDADKLHKANMARKWFLALTTLPERLSKRYAPDPMSSEAAASGTDWHIERPDYGYGWQADVETEYCMRGG